MSKVGVNEAKAQKRVALLNENQARRDEVLL